MKCTKVIKAKDGSTIRFWSNGTDQFREVIAPTVKSAPVTYTKSFDSTARLMSERSAVSM